MPIKWLFIIEALSMASRIGSHRGIWRWREKSLTMMNVLSNKNRLKPSSHAFQCNIYLWLTWRALPGIGNQYLIKGGAPTLIMSTGAIIIEMFLKWASRHAPITSSERCDIIWFTDETLFSSWWKYCFTKLSRSLCSPNDTMQQASSAYYRCYFTGIVVIISCLAFHVIVRTFAIDCGNSLIIVDRSFSRRRERNIGFFNLYFSFMSNDNCRAVNNKDISGQLARVQ